jgi:Icc protein
LAKIFQFTDLHVRINLSGHNGHLNRLSRHLPALLDTLSERVAQEAPDLVVVTGDLIDAPHTMGGHSDVDSFAVHRDAAVADYRYLRDWLEARGRPWMILPGNHDDPKAFSQVFGDRPDLGSVGDIPVHMFHDWEVEGHKAQRLGAQRERFERLIEAATASTREVHLQHYLIRPVVDYSYPLNYRDADELTARLAQAPGHRLVLSGHWHGGTPLTVIGRTTFSGCPAFTEPPHPYRVYTTDDGRHWTMQEKSLGWQVGPGRPLIIVDRTGVLSDASPAASGLSMKRDAAALVRGLSRLGTVVVASGWDEPDSTAHTWGGVQALLDDFFARMASEGGHADAMALYLSANASVPRRLPAERLCRETDLVSGPATTFGVAPTDAVFLSADPGRLRYAALEGAATIDARGATDGAALLTTTTAVVARRKRAASVS